MKTSYLANRQPNTVSNTCSYENSVRTKLIILTILIFNIVNALLNEGSYGGGDSITHYLISRYSWIHHEKFLDSWGKPFFTLVTSPFSQFGMTGLKLFHAVIGALTSYLCFKTAVKLNYKNPIAVLILLCTAPLHINCLNSGLTEPLFQFILVFSIFLILDARPYMAALIISFLPFVRSEGYLILPLVGMFFMFRREYSAIPLIFSGFIIYSVIGSFYYDDINWVMNQNTYRGQNFDIYGQGDLLHFVRSMPYIIGSAGAILIVPGLYVLIKQGFLKSGNHMTIKSAEILLIYLPFLIYFIAHSIFWWKGLFSSLGLVRPLGAVVPCAALIAARGYDAIFDSNLISKHKNTIPLILLTINIVVISVNKDFPIRKDGEELVLDSVLEWFENQDLKNNKLYLGNPYLIQKLNVDPYDQERSEEFTSLFPNIDNYGSDIIPKGSLIFWDSHFSANEGRIPLKEIQSHPAFEQIHRASPATPFKTLGDLDYEVYVFKKTEPKSRSIPSEIVTDFESRSNYFFGEGRIDTVNKFSGEKSLKIDPEITYANTFRWPLHTLKETDTLKKVVLDFKVYNEIVAPGVHAILSVSDTAGQSLYYNSVLLDPSVKTSWRHKTLTFDVSQVRLNPTDIISIYFHNPEKACFNIDDFKIRFSR